MSAPQPSACWCIVDPRMGSMEAVAPSCAAELDAVWATNHAKPVVAENCLFNVKTMKVLDTKSKQTRDLCRLAPQLIGFQFDLPALGIKPLSNIRCGSSHLISQPPGK